jgi:hypothetical protein
VLCTSLFVHPLEHESHDIDWVCCRGVMEFLWCNTKFFPVAHKWGVSMLVSNQVSSDHIYTDSCRSNIFLSSSKDNSILREINTSGSEVRTHVTSENHIIWNSIIWELWDLNSLNCFVRNVMEISSIFVNFPISRVSKGGVLFV